MAYTELALALGMIVTASPAAAQPQGAPPAPADARYCLRVDPPTGSRIETIRCETREVWAQLDVDVDQEWGQWGVRIIPSGGLSG